MKSIVAIIISGVLLPCITSAELPSAKIDGFIDQSLREKGIAPNPPARDEVFLKRIYLEIAGRLPSAGEAREFLESKNPQKNDLLIDKLLASDDYAHNFVNYWGDILRIKGRRGFGSVVSAGDRYSLYVFESLRDNKPYDKMVREIIALRGLVSENGAVGSTDKSEARQAGHLSLYDRRDDPS